MLMAMLRLFRLALRNTVPSPGAGNGGHPRVSSPCPTASTLITSAPRSPRYCAQSGPASTFDRSRTLMPSRGLDTIFLLPGQGLVQPGGKQATEIGGKSRLRNQNVVGCSPLRLVKLTAPARSRGLGIRQPRAQQLLTPGSRLVVMP